MWCIKILAAQFNDVKLINKFIDSSGDVNMLDLNSKSGLMWGTKFLLNLKKKSIIFYVLTASQYCSFDAVKALVQAHADLNLQDNLGQTALIFGKIF